MLYILYGLFFLSCVVLIGSVLLQPGKTDAGALFTSNVSSTAFAPRGTASVLSKFTIGAAALFMLSALMISMPALSGDVSVLQGTSEEAPAEAPAAVPAEAPPTTEANVAPGETQKIIIPADTNSNAAIVDVPTKPANAAPAKAAPANK